MQSNSTRDEPFAFVSLPAGRSSKKPRTKGLTMMLDHGLPIGYVSDIIEMAGCYIDLAKIKTGTARLYEDSYLRRKLDRYVENDVKPFIGGQFHEYVFAVYGQSVLTKFYDEAQRVGFGAIEISDNVVPLTDSQRRDQIRAACDAGLEVFGEVGAKDRRSTARDLISQAEICFGAGASLVLVEAAELVIEGAPNRQMLHDIRGALDMAKVMIELPGPWIPDVRHCDVEALKKILISEFGPDVNIANVAHDMIIDLEATRTALGVAGPGEMGLEDLDRKAG